MIFLTIIAAITLWEVIHGRIFLTTRYSNVEGEPVQVHAVTMTPFSRRFLLGGAVIAMIVASLVVVLEVAR